MKRRNPITHAIRQQLRWWRTLFIHPKPKRNSL